MTDALEEKCRLPKLVDAKFSNFDLYKNESTFETSMSKSVYCLIGANGLGKSSFLNAVIFAMTGAVPITPRKFNSAKEYYKSASRYDRIDDYFSGRISEESRETASVGITLSWGMTLVYVERRILREDSITELRVSYDNGEKWTELDTDNYEEVIKEESGLSFSLFVFLIHFVSVFDEERHLLMWDDEALTSALFIAFGANAEFAENYEALNRKFQKAGSKARNARFAAQQQEKRLAELQLILQPSKELDAELVEKTSQEALRLEAAADSFSERLRRLESELKDLDLKWFDLSSDLSELELEYRRLFNERLHKNSRIIFHPSISNSIEDDECSLCGTGGIAAIIEAKIKTNSCPLCDSQLGESKEKEAELISELKSIDIKIGKTRSLMESIYAQRERIKREVSDARDSFLRSEKEYKSYIENNSEYISSLEFSMSSNNASIKNKIRDINLDREAFIKDSEKFYRERDQARKEIEEYERSLQRSYERGAATFVPRFRELSESFIGLPIDIQLESKQGKTKVGFGLKLRMKDQLRLTSERLSESQRFFIDIALRMSLLEALSETPTSMIVDTPEGSLDIAYEARAGEMFSKFTQSHNSVLMTANLRSSELVLRLAEKKGAAGMQVVRMTDWAELSEVQRHEEALFKKAYETIEQTLRDSNAK